MREQERSFSLLVAPNLVKLLYDLSSALMDELDVFKSCSIPIL